MGVTDIGESVDSSLQYTRQALSFFPRQIFQKFSRSQLPLLQTSRLTLAFTPLHTKIIGKMLQEIYPQASDHMRKQILAAPSDRHTKEIKLNKKSNNRPLSHCGSLI